MPIKLFLHSLSQRRASPGTPPAWGEAWLGEELGEEGGLDMLYLDKCILQKKMDVSMEHFHLIFTDFTWTIVAF